MAADPQVIAWTQQAAKATGADPAALLATALMESGARRGAVGDVASGHPSYGPWQMRSQVGALGSHSPTWGNSYAAALNRAQEFARLNVHGGAGAAAVQRPADPTGYAAKVQANLAQARQLLGQPRQATPFVRTQPLSPSGVIPGSNLLASLTVGGNGVIQSVLDQNAQLAGTQSVQLPPMPPQPVARTAPAPNAINPTQPLGSANRGIYSKSNWAGADQGVDYRGTGHVTALANAVVTRVDPKSSWIGAGGKGTGAVISYRITTGPYAGRSVYVAENITPHVRVGQRVRAGQPIATAHGSFPYTESGWANAGGSPIGELGTSGTGRDFAKSWGLA